MLAADTTVVQDSRIFGKPADEAACVAMLRRARRPDARSPDGDRTLGWRAAAAGLSTSYVSFREIDADECRRYWASGEPAGKAGAYAIQGRGAVFVSRLEGSFSGVMGLPLFETAALLDAAGVRRWEAP